MIIVIVNVIIKTGQKQAKLVYQKIIQ